jgi:hypothetical protein
MSIIAQDEVESYTSLRGSVSRLTEKIMGLGIGVAPCDRPY